MPAVALSRVGARVVESGPGGQNLAAGAWQRLEALPDPRSPRGRIYPLACLVAVAVCAFTAAGNDRFTAVGQWIKRASQADLARLRAPWDPLAGRYRAPDEKTIRVVLDRLDPRALARALLGPRPRTAACPGPPAASVRDYRARRRAQQARMLARSRLRAVAVDGKTSRGARRADGTRVHLLGVAEHGGRLLDHLEVDVKHNETSHFTELLGSLDLAGAVVTFDALHTVRANLDWLVTDKKAHYIAVVKQNQPLLHAQIRALPRRQVPAGSVTRDTGHGRTETRTVKAAHVSRLDFPGARQAIKISRWRQDTATGKTSRETAYAITSLTSAHASTGDLARLVREHWSIETHHHIRDVSFGEDTATSRTGSGPANLATIRAAVITAIKNAGYLHVPEGRRDHASPAETLRLHGLD
ncbi:MAG TPA: ISAs1 family transposase [Streptosporangiaceae bacterium]|nr:ISAs1 family transposase [Streptosporangiaceae bacterium]